METLDNFKVAGVYGAIVLDSRSTKNGECNVRYRLTFNRERKYFRSGYSLTEDDWNLLGDNKSRNEELKTVKDQIIRGFKVYEAMVAEIAGSAEYTHELLIKRLKQGSKGSISELYGSKVTDLKSKGQLSTAGLYFAASQLIDKYNPGLKIRGITPKWLEGFERWALNENKLSCTTLSMYLRTLRTLLNEAVTENLILRSHYPFKNEFNKNAYVIPEGTGTKVALTIEQINAIVDYPPRTVSMRRSRDMFLLSFHLGGINFKDLLLLKWSNIKNGEIHFERAKTRTATTKKTKLITIPITVVSNQIIENLAYSTRPSESFILPYMILDPTPQDVYRITRNIIRQVNKHLAKIGEDLGIVGLSTMVARHTFATILKNSGVSIAFISESLGHRSVSTTENYLKAFESEQRRKNFEPVASIGANSDKRK